MRIQSFSINVGTAACNAGCPYCVARMTANKLSEKPITIRWDRFGVACRIAQQARKGLMSVMLTGQGEPLLFHGQLLEYLNALREYDFPLIDLQTNGTKLNTHNLTAYKKLGLTLVCISVAHHDWNISNNIMRIKGGFNFWEAVRMVHETGLSCRLNCTMTRTGVHNMHQVQQFLAMGRDIGVAQMTFREVERPINPTDVEAAQFVDREKPEGAAKKLYHLMKAEGYPELPRIPGGGRVFDVDGQNCAIGNCLTETDDPDDTRQIIYWPDGRITTSWHLKGARIL